MGTTSSQVVQSVGGWWNGSVSSVKEVHEIVISSAEKEWLTRENIRFLYQPDLNHYTTNISIDGTPVKTIPSGTHLTLKKIVKFDSGQIELFGIFKNEQGLFNVTELFVSGKPVIPKTRWLVNIYRTVLRVGSENIEDSFVYVENNMNHSHSEGMPITVEEHLRARLPPVREPGSMFFSKSL